MDGSYKKISLGLKIVITFHANGGNVTESSREISKGGAIGTLPVPTRSGYSFIGWFTDPSTGTEVGENTTFNSDDDLYAHWEVSHNYVASINSTKYESVQDAIDAVPTDNTKVIITILKDIDNENLIVRSNQNIEFDIGSYTISNTEGVIIDNSGIIEIKNGKIIRNGTNDQNRVIINNNGGTLNISGGEIKSNVYQIIRNYGTLNVINNENGGTFTISGGQVIGTKRQAIYNDGGTLLITGGVTLTNGSGATANRACVQNHNGTVTITGGTITSPSTSYPAVLNESTMTIIGGVITSNSQNGVNNTSNLTIGVKDGNISTVSPTITGKNYGLNNTSTFKFYDGTIKGRTASINGTIAEIEDNSTRVDDTEVISGNTYYTTHLE